MISTSLVNLEFLKSSSLGQVATVDETARRATRDHFDNILMISIYCIIIKD